MQKAENGRESKREAAEGLREKASTLALLFHLVALLVRALQLFAAKSVARSSNCQRQSGPLSRARLPPLVSRSLAPAFTHRTCPAMAKC